MYSDAEKRVNSEEAALDGLNNQRKWVKEQILNASVRLAIALICTVIINALVTTAIISY